MAARLTSVRTDLDLRILRPVAAGMLALAAVLPHLPGDPGLPCPLRSVAGVPCPFCGCTTAVKAVVHGDPAGALAASPLGVLIALAAVILVLRPRWIPTRLPVWPLLVLVALSWLFELGRFGFL